MHQASRKMAASKLAVIEAQLRDGAVEVSRQPVQGKHCGRLERHCPRPPGQCTLSLVAPFSNVVRGLRRNPSGVWCSTLSQVAVGSLTSEQLQDFTRKLRAAAADVHIVRLRCLPRCGSGPAILSRAVVQAALPQVPVLAVAFVCACRGARHNEYLAHESGANSHHPPYLSPSHIRDVNRTSSLVQDKM